VIEFTPDDAPPAPDGSLRNSRTTTPPKIRNFADGTSVTYQPYTEVGEMRRLVFAAAMLLLCVAPFFWFHAAAAQGTVSCATYDAWEWAQAVFESERTTYAALDADGDGAACPELRRGGFAPAFWTDRIPEDVQEAQIFQIIDGDTPETQNEQHCGGVQATDFATWALRFNDTPGVIYIEKDKTEKDKYGRELAYVWFTVDGQPYLLNHILINNGWAEDVDYGDRKYDAQLKQAATFAKNHTLGVYALCGDFDKPLPAQPTQAPAPTQPPAPIPVPTEIPQEPTHTGCDPNYTCCVPTVGYDLDCADIGFSVQVIGVDIHGFDREGDGIGCESYG
jgi:endonuclease YncB( thermonuclease family)